MHLSPSLQKAYTEERMTAREAQRLAQFIAWSPVIFQASRIMVKWGVLDALRDHPDGLTRDAVADAVGRPPYAIQVLLEASLSIGTVLVDPATDRYTLSKAGWFLLTDSATRTNLDFNHDVDYEGMFRLEEALAEGRPAGLEHFGPWPTLYEGLSSLPGQVQRSWFGFDHYYSDASFDEALAIVLDGLHPHTLLDVGGNTGRWAMRCVAYDADIRVTIVDLPQQLELMRRATAGLPGADRIGACAADLLNPATPLPTAGERPFDVIWMSQFLDCFSEEQVRSILGRARAAMSPASRLCIMETCWDRQRYETAALCLTQTSLYFTAMANGNSKMFHSDDLQRLIADAGLTVEAIHDHLGHGHSLFVCAPRDLDESQRDDSPT